jgi:DNA-binding XRE family transcriptional regulator
MTGYHTRWVRAEELAEDSERIAIREALAFGKAVYDVRIALGYTVAELAERTDMSEDDIERIEEGGTEPTGALLRRLAAASTPKSASPPVMISAPSGARPTPPNGGCLRTLCRRRAAGRMARVWHGELRRSHSSHRNHPRNRGEMESGRRESNPHDQLGSCIVAGRQVG